MVIDDDKDILSIISTGLERAGFKVHGFSDPEIALQHIERDGCKECDLIISDVRMPKLNGFQLIRKVKKVRPNMKVVMMTAFEINMKEFASVFPSTPVEQVIRKPFPPSKLTEIVKEIYREKPRT